MQKVGRPVALGLLIINQVVTNVSVFLLNDALLKLNYELIIFTDRLQKKFNHKRTYVGLTEVKARRCCPP